jgi:hypothetical protein
VSASPIRRRTPSALTLHTRAAGGSQVVRGAKREFISRSSNLLLRRTLSARFSDAQQGFKAIRADVAARLLPMVNTAAKPQTDLRGTRFRPRLAASGTEAWPCSASDCA